MKTSVGKKREICFNSLLTDTTGVYSILPIFSIVSKAMRFWLFLLQQPCFHYHFSGQQYISYFRGIRTLAHHWILNDLSKITQLFHFISHLSDLLFALVSPSTSFRFLFNKILEVINTRFSFPFLQASVSPWL